MLFINVNTWQISGHRKTKVAARISLFVGRYFMACRRRHDLRLAVALLDLFSMTNAVDAATSASSPGIGGQAPIVFAATRPSMRAWRAP